MKRIAKKLLWTPVVSLLILASLLIFGTAQPPPTAPAITRAFARIDMSRLPAVQRYRARDGAELSYRAYPAGGNQVAVLIHGSAGSSADMHPLAQALQAANVTVLVPDLRGQGWNQPHGDIAYVGQLEDDLADFLGKEKPNYPGTLWTALGFSSGAAFTLRVAAQTPLGLAFDRYVIVSPYLRYNAPSVRPAASGTHNKASGSAVQGSQSWAAASIGRIVALTILNRVGVHLFDGLPVVAFPVAANVPYATQTYSWRLQQNFGAHNNYLEDIRRISRPVDVFVGGSDELLDAEKLKDEFNSERTDVPVVILPGMGHSDMVTNLKAIRVLVATVS